MQALDYTHKAAVINIKHTGQSSMLIYKNNNKAAIKAVQTD